MRGQGVSLKKGIKDLERVPDRAGPDTVKLWDSYREQALLWRAIALLQLPALFFALAMAMITFLYSDQVVEAPLKPEPSYFEIEDVSDEDLIRAASKFVNLITSFKPETAQRQFLLARNSLWEPALTAFNNEFLHSQLKIINETRRSQLFYVSERMVKVIRGKGWATVRIPGERQKLIGSVPMPSDQIAWYIKMTTVPRNELNELGLVVIDLKPESVDLARMAAQDIMEERLRRRRRRR